MRLEGSMYDKMKEIISETTEDIVRLAKEQGFKEKGTDGACIYYLKDGEEYTLARTGQNRLIVVADDLVREIDFQSLFHKPRKCGDVPARAVNGEPVPLHRSELGEVDHINHNTDFCVRWNFRECSSEENNKNRRCSAKIKEHYYYTGEYAGYRYEVRLDESQAEELLQIGFTVKPRSRRKGQITLQSPIREKQVMAYLDYAMAERILLKGTDMAQYIYDIKNDFSETLNLLIHHYVLKDITEEEMYEMNLLYWEIRLEEEKYAA